MDNIKNAVETRHIQTDVIRLEYILDGVPCAIFLWKYPVDPEEMIETTNNVTIRGIIYFLKSGTSNIIPPFSEDLAAKMAGAADSTALYTSIGGVLSFNIASIK